MFISDMRTYLLLGGIWFHRRPALSTRRQHAAARATDSATLPSSHVIDYTSPRSDTPEGFAS